MSITESSFNITTKSNISECTDDEFSSNLLDVNVSASLLDDTETIPEASSVSINEHNLSITLDPSEQVKLKELRLHQNAPQNDTVEKDDMSMTTAMEQFADMCREEAVTGETVLEISDAIEETVTGESVLEVSDAIEEEMHATCSGTEDYFVQPIFELGRRLWESTPRVQRYTKGCLWSPDGTCILVPVHMDGMHVIELPCDLYTPAAISSDRIVNELRSAVHVREGGVFYDCAWYPFMHSSAPESCCWISSRQHEPIHLWDAFNGELRCTYRGYDNVDEVEAAISVAFSLDGLKVMGGYKKSIKIFDTNVPGRDCSTLRVKKAVSCMAQTADSADTVTTGSWNGYISHYDLRAPKLGALFTLGGHSGGITLLRYTTVGGNQMLYSGARKDNKLLQWDMRNYRQPLREFHREVKTNQCIYFDLSADERWLVSGGTDGQLRIWDLNKSEEAEELSVHKDCCNGVNFHPTRPILATSAGQYHFPDVEEGRQSEIVDYENSLLFLWIGKHEAPEIN